MDFWLLLQTNVVVQYLVVAVIADLIPSPIDPAHFYLQNYLYNHRQKKGWFEFLQIADWYFLDASYYALLLGIVLFFNIEEMSKVQALTTLLTIVGIGASISIIWRFSRRRR